jgi:hypothetical protein
MRIAKRQRSKERSIDEAENRGRRPDTETEDRDRGNREPRCLLNQADCLADVVWQGHAA